MRSWWIGLFALAAGTGMASADPLESHCLLAAAGKLPKLQDLKITKADVKKRSYTVSPIENLLSTIGGDPAKAKSVLSSYTTVDGAIATEIEQATGDPIRMRSVVDRFLSAKFKPIQKQDVFVILVTELAGRSIEFSIACALNSYGQVETQPPVIN